MEHWMVSVMLIDVHVVSMMGIVETPSPRGLIG